MNELGLAAWHGAGRTVTETDVERACERAGLSEQLARFQEGARACAIGLLAAFYFRQAGKIEGGERTFEFTHKSFGESLTARRLVDGVAELEHDRTQKIARRRRWDEESVLRDWCSLTGPTAIDADLFAFIWRQVEVVKAETENGAALVDRWRETLAELLTHQLHYGLPLHAVGLPSFREKVDQARNSEEALFALHFRCASTVQRRSRIRWPDGDSLLGAVTRVSAGGDRRLAIGWLDYQNDEQFTPHMRFWANLTRANIQCANLQEAVLIGANLAGARLQSVNLEGGMLLAAFLHQANLRKANLRGAHLHEVIFTNATLKQADFAGADFREADLREANLERSNLKCTDLVWVKTSTKRSESTKLKVGKARKLRRSWSNGSRSKGSTLRREG